jgi:hypothetical protein
MTITDARSDAERFTDDATLAALAGQLDWTYLDRDSLLRLAALGDVHHYAPDGFGLSDAGRGRLAVLRISGDLPRGIVTVTHTVPGATLHYWPNGFGRRRILAARYVHRTRLTDYAEAFHPIGTSGRSETLTLAEAHRQVTARALTLEAEAEQDYRNPWE